MVQETIVGGQEERRAHLRLVPLRADGGSGSGAPLRAPLQRSSTEGHAPVSNKPKLLDQVREAIRTRHYSYRTEKAYIGWIKRFIFFQLSQISSLLCDALA